MGPAVRRLALRREEDVVPKIDYYGDPNAPAANRLAPIVNVAVLNDSREILLIRRSDDGYWALPGGFMELGESMAAAAVREAREETGVHLEVTGIVGIYTDPAHVTAFDDGTVTQQCTVCFAGRVVGGRPAVTAEAAAVRFVPAAELDGLRIHPAMRLRINHGLAGGGTPYIG
ncbi:NUDIX domain-containing protein [Parafrankia colletiae]|uniref:NUDIX domain-containing protein n=1 Tax=Parafrankia colletiae TaxID=573497 RepID=UPI00389910BC